VHQEQLAAIARLGEAFERQGIDYWLFGGWAVDFHAGRITRPHADVDVAAWLADADRIHSSLEAMGWQQVPEPDADGYAAYELEHVRVEVAFLARDDDGTVYTPLTDGRGLWPTHSFGDDFAELEGVRARTISLQALIADKSAAHGDDAVAAKDRLDVTVLERPRDASA
jgi:hypothetical protein